MKLDITKTLAHKSGKNPKKVIGVWSLIFVVSLVLIGTMLSDALTTEEEFSANPESIKANDLMAERIDRNREDDNTGTDQWE